MVTPTDNQKYLQFLPKYYVQGTKIITLYKQSVVPTKRKINQSLIICFGCVRSLKLCWNWLPKKLKDFPREKRKSGSYHFLQKGEQRVFQHSSKTARRRENRLPPPPKKKGGEGAEDPYSINISH